jgi:menaquinone-dependent protoporphyrinogen oxidase
MKLLLLYGTKKGSTAEVADFIAAALREEGLEVDVANASDFREDIGTYDAFILGSPVYTGLWLPYVLQTIDTLIPAIGQKPVYCWVSCIRVLEPEGYQHVRQNYMPVEIFSRLNVQDVAVFAGKLDLNEIDFDERWTLAIRYDGVSNPTELTGDYRNWDAIRAWAHKIALHLRQHKPAAE